MLLQSADKTLKPKEIPIADFFHKIVMLRDRLRVLEQNINSHKKLSDEEKVNIQPVSYTHLDVYKRQPLYSVIGYITPPEEGKHIITRAGNKHALVAQGWNHMKEH